VSDRLCKPSRPRTATRGHAARGPKTRSWVALIAVSAIVVAIPARWGTRAADVKGILRGIEQQLDAKPPRVTNALDRYDKAEKSRDLSAAEKYRIFEQSRKVLSELVHESVPMALDRAVAQNTKPKANSKAKPRPLVPSGILALRVIAEGKHSLSATERVARLVEIARHDDGRLSRWGTRLLGELGAPEAVDALIEILRAEESRGSAGSLLAYRAATELYRELGAIASSGTAAGIEKAWREGGRSIPKRPDYGLDFAGAGGAARTVSFFGDRISPRSIFCIDTSSSMLQLARIRKLGGRTVAPGDSGASEPKIDVVKRELERAVGSLLVGFEFNILGYSRSWFAWKGAQTDLRLEAATAESLPDAARWARSLRTGSGTNIHDTLVAALGVPNVDTIYLLSDGEPSVGGTVKQIEERVRIENYLRGARIVAYGIVPEAGTAFDEAFLRRLGSEHGGWYRRLNDR
jgi:hypothetical protein